MAEQEAGPREFATPVPDAEIDDCSIAVLRNRQGNRSLNHHMIKTARDRRRRFAVVMLGDEAFSCHGARAGGSEFAPVLIRNYW